MSAAAPSTHVDSILPTVWDYTHPVTGETVFNVEALCRKVLNRLAAGCSPPLQPTDYAESLSWLLGEIVILAEQKYDPARATSLGDFLNARMPGVLIDYWRRFYGRDGQKRPLAAGHAGHNGGSQDERGSTPESADDSPAGRVDELALGRVGVLRLLEIA